MAKRFVLLDRDGTVIVDRHYLGDPDGVELLPGAAEGLVALRRAGWGLAVVTNQSAVGRGMFPAAAVAVVNRRMEELLLEQGARLDGIYACLHAPADGCRCRKPLPGLVEEASKELGFTPSESVVVGDRASDLGLARAVAARAVLVSSGVGKPTGTVRPDLVVSDLMDLVRRIAEL